MTAEAASRYSREMGQGVGVSQFIPYRAHVSPSTIVTGDGDFLRIWKLEGIAFATAELEDIVRRKDELNMVWRGIGNTHTAIWTHQVRRRVGDRLMSTFNNSYSERIDKAYYDSLSERPSSEDGVAADPDMMVTELYVTLVYRPCPTQLDKMHRKSAKRSLDEVREDRRQAMLALDDISRELQAGLRRYDPVVLSCFDVETVTYSQPLTFLNYLVTGEWQRVRVPRAPINEALGNAYVFVGTETMLLRGPLRDRYAQLIDFKDYPEHTEPGILNKAMMTQSEYVITQSFSFMDKRQSLKYLDRTAKQLKSSEDGSLTQQEQLITAVDELTNGRFVLGEYHFTLMVFGDTRDAMEKSCAELLTLFKEDGFLAVKVATATDAGFYAQLPCNWRFRPRVANLTSLNFAGLAPLHNFPHGKRDGNPWGQALTLLKTPSQQPLYFNFHASKEDEDSYDKKVLGNTRIIGASGTGKTVLMNFLLSQATKYAHRSGTGFGVVFFDKDRGAELAIRAMGGRYLPLKSGEPTGFNPFQMDPTERNLLFLERWVGELATQGGGEKLTATEEQQISHAVRSVMRMPNKALRRLSVVHQNIPEGTTALERENGVSRRLAKWIQGGTYAWVADNPTDALDLTTHSMYGFDGTAFLDDPVVCPAISSYLLHRMEEMIDGRRFIYFMDEMWKWVQDNGPANRPSAMAEFAGNKQLTIRKQNGLGVFATQMPSSLLNSPIGAELVQQVATEIYLPNPRADRDEYVKGFKLTDTEFEMVAALQEDSRMFMVKQGHRSSIAKLDLGALGKDLRILSGSTDNIELLDQIRDELGDQCDDVDVWLPEFHRRCDARTALSRGLVV